MQLYEVFHRFSLYTDLLYFIFVLNIIQYVHNSQAEIVGCDFEDTVNITDSIRFDNGSYQYENMLIPSSLVGVYDYEELYQGVLEPVPPHTRGCICQLRPCVKFCCHSRALRVNTTRKCSQELDEELSYSPYVNITFEDGSQRSVHVLDEFAVQQGIPCHYAFPLLPENPFDIGWELFENGTLLRTFDKAYFTKRDYCLTPHKENDTYVLTPLNCPNEIIVPETQIFNLIAMLISVPFLILTALVYILVPELRNLHGKCLVSYLTSLALAYILFVMHSLVNIDFSDEVCSALGFSDYFFFMAAFFWLSVISFDLWHNFCDNTGKVQQFTRRTRFSLYSIYAWGLALLMTVLTYLAELSDWDESLKPGIGSELYCWIKPDDWSGMIYFYGPIFVLMFFNTILYILTSVKIYKVKQELQRVVAPEERMQRFKKHNDNFGLFLRLFVVMGVSWLLEVFSFMVGSFSHWSILFYLPDLCNAAQGIIIFTLFVMKRKVLSLIKRRVQRPEEEPLKQSSRTGRYIRSMRTSRSTVPTLTKLH